MLHILGFIITLSLMRPVRSIELEVTIMEPIALHNSNVTTVPQEQDALLKTTIKFTVLRHLEMLH